MSQIENKDGAENGDNVPTRSTLTVRIRKVDMERLERYQVDAGDTPAAVISRLIDMCDHDHSILQQMRTILYPDRLAKTDELLIKTEELIDLIRSEKQ